MLGTMWLFEKQTRYASYDIHMVAWVTLAMAAATTDRTVHLERKAGPATTDPAAA